MPDSFDGMLDLDQPVTRRELRYELAAMEARLADRFATKDDLRNFATKDDLCEFATKAELRAEIQAAKDELRGEMSAGFAEMRAYIDYSIGSLRDELRRHFDLTAESFRSDFRSLYDWTLATTQALATRVDRLEQRDASGPRTA